MKGCRISVVIPVELRDKIKDRASKNFRCLSGEIAAVLSKEFLLPNLPPSTRTPPEN